MGEAGETKGEKHLDNLVETRWFLLHATWRGRNIEEGMVTKAYQELVRQLGLHPVKEGGSTYFTLEDIRKMEALGIGQETPRRSYLSKAPQGVYQEASKTTSSHVDHPPDEPLLGEKESDEALSEVVRIPFSEREEHVIRAAHKICDNSKIVSRVLGYSRKEVLNVWHTYNLPLYNRKEQVQKDRQQLGSKNKGQFQPLPLEERLTIVGEYYPTDGNARRAAKKLHHAPTTILTIWKYVGFETFPPYGQPGSRTISPEGREEINALWEPTNGNAVRAEELCGHQYSRTTITKYWHLAGKEVHQPGQRKKIEVLS